MATEALAPDVLITQTNLTGAVTDIDESPDSPDGVWLNEVDDALDTICHVSFGTPTGNPTTGAGLQSFRIYCRRSTTTGGNDPDLDIALYENGTLVSTLQTGVAITSLTGQLVTATWDASLLGTTDGSLVELYLIGNRSGGGPSARRTVEFDAVEWAVDYTLGTAHVGSGSFATSASVTSAALVSKQGDGSITASSSLTGAALVSKVGAGDFAASSTVSASVTLLSQGNVDVTTNTSLSSSASVFKVGAGAISTSVSATADALVTKPGASALNVLATLQSDVTLTALATADIDTSVAVSSSPNLHSKPQAALDTSVSLSGAATRIPVSTAYTDYAATNYLELKLAEAIVNNIPYTAGTSLYLALHTSPPTETGAWAEVPIINGYTRELITFSSVSDTVHKLNSEVVFTASGGSWGTITHYSIWDAASAGNSLIYGELNVPYTISDLASITFEVDNFRISSTGSLISATDKSLIDAVTSNVSYASGSVSFYMSLHSGSPGVTGNSNELPPVGGYSRLSPSLDISSNTIRLSTALKFTATGSSWGTVTDYVIRSTTGDPIFSGTLDSARTIADGDTLNFAQYSITVPIG